jgi:hypothetical protein
VSVLEKGGTKENIRDEERGELGGGAGGLGENTGTRKRLGCICLSHTGHQEASKSIIGSGGRKGEEVVQGVYVLEVELRRI